MLTHERLQELLSYDSLTGNFYWRQARGCRKAYSEAGVINHDYRVIKIDSKRYGAHQLGVFYMLGVFPENDVDHINGIKSDNRWNNLRLATRQQNAANAKLNKGNFLGIKNVRQLPDTKKYQVIVGGKSYGCFTNLEWAKAVATEVRNQLFGEFARHA